MKNGIIMVWLVLILGIQSLMGKTAAFQSERTVDLHVRSEPLRHILSDLSRQTRTFFVFSDSLVNGKIRSCSVQNRSLTDVLSIVLGAIDYKVIDEDLIVLFDRPESEPDTTIDVVEIEDKADSGVIRAPQMLQFEKPEYPKAAISQKESGRVKLSLRINAQGRVESVLINESSGSELLDSTAVQHVRETRFTPAYSNGGPIAVWMEMNFDFKLSNQKYVPKSDTQL